MPSGASLVASVGRQDADDVFQETFLAAMRAYPRLRPDSNLRAWVLTIAHRKALDHSPRPSAGADCPGESPRSPTTTADAGDERCGQQVRELPAKQRAAVTLRYAADLDYAAIAKARSAAARTPRDASAHEGIKKLRKEAEPA